MPEIDVLMQEWPTEFEDLLKEVSQVPPSFIMSVTEFILRVLIVWCMQWQALAHSLKTFAYLSILCCFVFLFFYIVLVINVGFLCVLYSVPCSARCVVCRLNDYLLTYFIFLCRTGSAVTAVRT